MEFHDKLTLSIAEAAKDVMEGKKQEEVKYPHDMYKGDDVKSAKNAEEHDALADDGYTHEKPVDEVAEPEAKGEKDFKGKHKVKKSGEKEDGTVVKEGKFKDDMIDDSETMSKKDFIKKYGKQNADDLYEKAELEEIPDEAIKMHEDFESEKAIEEGVSEASAKQKKYQAFFQKALKKFGVKTPAELEGDKKKEFFDYVDAGYEADNEED